MTAAIEQAPPIVPYPGGPLGYLAYDSIRYMEGVPDRHSGADDMPEMVFLFPSEIIVFDHLENPRHPTWWHVRDYGLFAANPFGVHDFEGKPKGTGDLTIPSGRSVTFRYRFYFHKGNTEQAEVADRYREYAENN